MANVADKAGCWVLVILLCIAIAMESEPQNRYEQWEVHRMRDAVLALDNQDRLRADASQFTSPNEHISYRTDHRHGSHR